MDESDLEPRQRVAPKKNLEPLAIEELEAYIAELESEILRAKNEIAAKRKQRSGAEALFKR
jgi:uncharacterized small protein (DUF1192 family)